MTSGGSIANLPATFKQQGINFAEVYRDYSVPINSLNAAWAAALASFLDAPLARADFFASRARLLA